MHSELLSRGDGLEGHGLLAVETLGELCHLFALFNADIVDGEGLTLEPLGHESFGDASGPINVGLLELDVSLSAEV